MKTINAIMDIRVRLPFELDSIIDQEDISTQRIVVAFTVLRIFFRKLKRNMDRQFVRAYD